MIATADSSVSEAQHQRGGEAIASPAPARASECRRPRRSTTRRAALRVSTPTSRRPVPEASTGRHDTPCSNITFDASSTEVSHEIVIGLRVMI